MSFERFENRWEITGKIKMETPLRIGASVSQHSLSSAPVLLQYDAKNGIHIPFIPGSSLKGVLLSASARIVKTHGLNDDLTNKIFGSPEGGSSVRARDAVCENYTNLEERIHCATAFKEDGDYYNVVVEHNKPKTNLMTEENIPPNVTFNLKIDMDNATEEDVNLILLALKEIKYKRVQLGGGVSRGYGFATVEEINVIKMELDGFDPIPKEKPVPLMNDILGTKLFSQGNPRKLNQKYDGYYRAEDETLNGNIVCEFDVKCITDFYMKGAEADEPMVTSSGIPTIPGSVIKGFLRHSCYKTPVIKGKQPRFQRYDEPVIRWKKEKVNDIFGSQEWRSRLLVSDAFFEDEDWEQWTGFKNGKPEKIKQGARLKCWIVFDNMSEQDIKTLVMRLNDNVPITGGTSAKGHQRGEKRYNKVKFKLKKAWKYTLTDPKYDITDKLLH